MGGCKLKEKSEAARERVLGEGRKRKRGRKPREIGLGMRRDVTAKKRVERRKGRRDS